MTHTHDTPPAWQGVTVYLVTTSDGFDIHREFGDALRDYADCFESVEDARIWEWQAGQVPVDVTPKVPA